MNPQTAPTSPPPPPPAHETPREMENCALLEERAGQAAWNIKSYLSAATHFEQSAGMLRKCAAHVTENDLQAALKRKAAKLVDFAGHLQGLAAGRINEVAGMQLRNEMHLEMSSLNADIENARRNKRASRTMRPVSVSVAPAPRAQEPPAPPPPAVEREKPTTEQVAAPKRTTTEPELKPVDVGPPLRHGRMRELLAGLGSCDFEKFAKCFDDIAEDFATAKSVDKNREMEMTLTSIFSGEISAALRKAKQEQKQGHLVLARKSYAEGDLNTAAEHFKQAAMEIIGEKVEGRTNEQIALAEIKACRFLTFSSRLRQNAPGAPPSDTSLQMID